LFNDLETASKQASNNKIMSTTTEMYQLIAHYNQLPMFSIQAAYAFMHCKTIDGDDDKNARACNVQLRDINLSSLS